MHLTLSRLNILTSHNQCEKNMNTTRNIFGEINLDKELEVFLLEGSKSGVWDNVVLVGHWNYRVVLVFLRVLCMIGLVLLLVSNQICILFLLVNFQSRCLYLFIHVVTRNTKIKVL